MKLSMVNGQWSIINVNCQLLIVKGDYYEKK